LVIGRIVGFGNGRLSLTPTLFDGADEQAILGHLHQCPALDAQGFAIGFGNLEAAGRIKDNEFFKVVFVFVGRICLGTAVCPIRTAGAGLAGGLTIPDSHNALYVTGDLGIVDDDEDGQVQFGVELLECLING
jgi:hypothetical protein